MSYYCNEPRLIPGKAHSIIERDEAGNIIGTYTGYYNPSRYVVTLYPDYRHLAYKVGWKLGKRQISAGLIRCKIENGKSKVKDEAAGNAGIKSQTSRAMKDIIGQIKLNF